MAQPTNMRTSLAELARLADEIWFLAGDVSVDTSWYTKRATLSAIYSSTGLFTMFVPSHRRTGGLTRNVQSSS
jgi:ubiquinone biosynthesis protein COQ9